MTTKPRVTAAEAHAILRDVERAFRPWIDADRWYARTLGKGRPGYDKPSRPKLVRRYEPYWGGGVIPYAILWEGGPSEWVHQYLWGEPDPELLAEGSTRTVEPKHQTAAFLEAGTSFILCIFPPQG